MDHLDYPDNLVLHLERDKHSYKCYTTDDRNKFKIIKGLSIYDGVINRMFITERELKQLFIDESVNGYELKTNLVFKKGLHGIAKELAAERATKLAAERATKLAAEEGDLTEN